MKRQPPPSRLRSILKSDVCTGAIVPPSCWENLSPLRDITSFAASTPFQLPGLIEASKRLFAFSVAQEEIIPNNPFSVKDLLYYPYLNNPFWAGSTEITTTTSSTFKTP